MKNCNGRGYDKERKIAIFAIDQEIDSINKYYIFESKKNKNLPLKKKQNSIIN